MLPAIISREIEEGIKSYLRTTFPPSTPTFQNTLDEFLDRPGNVFKGPYYQLRLPFRPAATKRLPLTTIDFPYPPHLHQAQAVTRLGGDEPLSTLVATGTGSGKTECFLYPILDYCAARGGTKGIKAIVIYPMNALATDQAKRFAAAIHSNDHLRGKVTAGLFIGDEGDAATAMSENWVITHKGQMQSHPPDILLTNYKMLDYLLLRPSAQQLWRDNTATTLRYLVVDELHTFDGAQATDLACLIRRLKARLRTPERHLVCVGTSATLGGNAVPLVEYAGKIFAEPFGEDCVIGETLLTLADLVEGQFIRHHVVPAAADILSAERSADPAQYLRDQFRVWFQQELSISDQQGRVKLGEMLLQHSFFRNLITLAERSGLKILSEEWLAHGVVQMLGTNYEPAEVKAILDSFLSLCAHARYNQRGHIAPLLRVHVHLWTRELHRLVTSVCPEPIMAFDADLNEEARKTHLPPLHCRDCGAMGWGGTMRANENKVDPSLKTFYQAFFGSLPTLRLIFPSDGREGGNAGEVFSHALCSGCLGVNPVSASSCTVCGNTEVPLVPVWIPQKTKRVRDHMETDRACPYCDSASGLTIVGLRSATLTSVALAGC